MLDLNVNKNRTLTFEIQLGGINPDQIEGSLTFIIDNIQYGVPVKIKEKEISVNIPPLNSISLKKFTEGEEIHAKLEAHGNGYYLNPWNGSFIVKNPIVMEASITENERDIESPEINIESISDKKQGSKEIIKDKSRETEEEVKDKPDDKIGDIIKNKVNEKRDMISRLVDKALEGKSIKKTKTIIEKKIIKSSPKKKITEKDILEYIQVFGTKNKQIQEIILEQSQVAASEEGNGNDINEVFKKVQLVLPRGKNKKR